MTNRNNDEESIFVTIIIMMAAVGIFFGIWGLFIADPIASRYSTACPEIGDAVSFAVDE